jgi:signal transduction histidine kinase
MSLRWRIAIGFALVALATAAVVALATPPIVNQGFAELDEADEYQATQVPSVAPATTPSAAETEAGAPETEAGSSEPETGAGETESEAEDGVPATTRATTRPATPSPTVTPAPTATAAPTASAAPTTTPTPAGGTAGTAGDANEDGGPAQAAGPSPTTSQVQQSTIIRLVLAAALAALAASLLGLLAAGRLVRPLNRLEQAAAALAHGDLTRRSGVADRSDEFGQLGRTFDAMADELQRADETRRGFLQDAAHELKTPLAVIDATSSAILDGVYAPEQKHIATIRDQSRILARIVDDLRTISLAEGGHLPLERRPVELATTLSSVAAGFEARATAQGTKLAVDAPAGLAAEADPDRVRQMASALVDNALRHTPPGGTVRLAAAPATNAGTGSSGRSTARVPRPAVRISVEDTGPGIPPDVLPRIFERFFQADPSHSRGTSTSGLGLSIVKALAEAQGGRAGAENMPSGGARLWFELPSR